MDETHTVLGICHASEVPADLSYLESLNMPLEPFADKERYLCIFSTAGFTPELTQAAAEAGNVWLIDLEDTVL